MLSKERVERFQRDGFLVAGDAVDARRLAALRDTLAGWVEESRAHDAPFGSAGDCYDNAVAEIFFATVECEFLDRPSFRTRTGAKMALFDFIEGWYNRHRRHCALGYLSPDDFEHAARRRATTGAIAQDEVPNHPRGRPPTPGTRKNLPSPVIVSQTNRGENHQPSTRPG